MFRYSKDDFLSGKQQEAGTELLEALTKKYYLVHSPAIESLFDKYVHSYEFIEELPKLSILSDNPIIMPMVPRNHKIWAAEQDLEIAYRKLNKSKSDMIPFIEFSFPEDYDCKHGESYRHVYSFFFTHSMEFEVAQECVVYHLTKLNNLKVFL
jgi:hypothetical protein